MYKILIGQWRDDRTGPMQIVSGPLGREKVHFEAPSAERLESEMTAFLVWLEADQGMDKVLKAGLAHFWFVTIHPFEDGNGRMARAIGDLMLARSENSTYRFYSLSAQIQKERAAYYQQLEDSQKGDLDITDWLRWFLECLERAIEAAQEMLESVLFKARFWETHRDTVLSERQRKMLNRLLDGFTGKLTSSKWAKICKCSQDTAHRDIMDLIDKQVLRKEEGGGRSSAYTLN